MCFNAFSVLVIRSSPSWRNFLARSTGARAGVAVAVAVAVRCLCACGVFAIISSVGCGGSKPFSLVEFPVVHVVAKR